MMRSKNIWQFSFFAFPLRSRRVLKNDKDLLLREDLIVQTVARLNDRIRDRFPDAGLSKLCGQLHQVALQAAERSAWISTPILWIRVASVAVAVFLIAFTVGLVMMAMQSVDTEKISFFEAVQAADSGLSEIILVSIAILFLFSLETRIKRRRALDAIRELRSIAHIIDMHQLTKDPERFLKGWSDAEHSPKRNMTPMQLNRYLDYCSEMLSLIGKIAALYVQQFNDPDAVAAVSEVEQLSTGLSRKIWQKIMILQQLREAFVDTASEDFSGAGDSLRGEHEHEHDDVPSPAADSQRADA